jgi:dTDP-4-dehydrorhamnose reductase
VKVLITGSKGQLGRELRKQFRKNDEVSLVLTDIDEMDITDIRDVERVLFLHKPDVVINCAAHTAVDLCEDDKENAFIINVKGAENLAVVSNEIDAVIVHISTDYVFDGEGDRPYVEEDNTNPQSVYGKTKLDSERVVIQKNPKHFILRTAWLYGDGRNFVGTMLELAKRMDSLKVVDDQIGNPTSAKQVAIAIIKLIETDEYGLYHGTCDGECSWYDFAKRIFEINNIDIEVEPCTTDEFPLRAKRPKYSVLDNKNFRERLGYKFAKWQDAIEEYFQERK